MTYNIAVPPPSYAIPKREPGEAATAFVERVRRLLRRAFDAGDGIRKLTYDAALREAYAAGDMEAFTAIASLGAVFLEAESRHEEAIDQLDFAISLAGRDEGAVAYLLCTRGIYEALLGRAAAARRTVARAGRLAVRNGANRGIMRQETSSSVVDCITLRSLRPESVADAIAKAERAGIEAESGALKTWAIPYFFALGDARTARPWIEVLRLQAEASMHRARIQDAEVFAYALAVRSHQGGRLMPVPPLVEPGANPNAEWRHRLLTLRVALLLGRWEEARSLCDQLTTSNPRFPSGLEPPANPFRDLVRAYEGSEGDGVTLPPPRFVTLGNLPVVLAGMEAVAIAGSQRAAAAWLDQTNGLLPSLVQSSIEWPVMAARVRGLLHVRAGALQAGAALLRRSIGLAEAAGNAVEAGLAQLQLSEVLSLGQVKASRFGEARGLHREGWDRLARAGISPIPFAYSASRVIGLHRDERSAGNLSPRETEVLSLLSEGLTFKGVGDRLGISWRTAQLHAARAYAKLGAHGRISAIETARQMGVL